MNENKVVIYMLNGVLQEIYASFDANLYVIDENSTEEQRKEANEATNITHALL